MSRTDCSIFDEHVDELALGQLDEPLRSHLLAHATACPGCHASLESLGAVVDRLLLATPQVEPPAGFESRVLQRIPHTSAAAPPRRSVRRRLATVAAVIAAFVAGGVIARQFVRDSAAETAPIVTTEAVTIGSVELADSPVPRLVVTITSPQPDPGIRTCELRRPDGSWEPVGWWDGSDIASGVWAVGIDPDLLDATAMRITADGRTLATATFD